MDRQLPAGWVINKDTLFDSHTRFTKIHQQPTGTYFSYVTHLGPREDLVWGWINSVMFSFFGDKSH